MQESAFSIPDAGVDFGDGFSSQPGGAESIWTRLDAIVIENGGRVYLAKDARLKAGILRQSDPRADTLCGLSVRAWS